jgi:hypothetical protein
MAREYLGKWVRDRDVLLIGFLLLVRMIVFGMGPGIINGDGFLYVHAAQHIAQTGALPPAGFQSRSYSLVMAPILMLLGHDAVWVPLPDGVRQYYHPIGVGVHWFQLLLDLAVVLALLRYCFDLRGRSKWLFRIAYVAVVLQPITASWTNFMVPDTLAMTSFFVGLFYLARGPFDFSRANLAIGALLLGVSGFVRIDVAALALAVLGLWILIVLWRGPRDRRLVATIAGVLALFAAPSVAMAGYQYASTGTPNYIQTAASDNPGVAMRGYFSWTRGWLMTPGEFQTFILSAPGSKDWVGFKADRYPARALPAGADRAALQAALDHWAANGYDPATDRAFLQLASAQQASRPLTAYAAAPLARTAALWLNTDGGSAVTWGLHLRPPFSWIAVAAVTLLKLAIALFAAIGSVAVCRRIWRAPDSAAAAIDYPASLAVLSILAIAMRFCEMLALNVLIGGAVMESRYVVEVWPCLIVLALYGYARFDNRFGETVRTGPAAVDTL